MRSRLGSLSETPAQGPRKPGGLLFTEFQALAECFGFEHVRTRGSHHLFKRPGHVALLNFQSRRGEARAYQVRQLLDAIDAIAREDENHERP